MNLVVALLALAAAPEPEPPELVKPPALFQRAEPNLEAGAELLAEGEVDAAIEAFRAAKPESADERAVVEYDVASALLARAAIAAEAAQKAAQAQQGPNGTPPSAPPAAPDMSAATTDLDDAKGAFERAYGLAKDARLKSEAALAAGNTAITKGDVDEAIAQYRKSLVADPRNERAKKNLRRALDAKRAQPPPPPQQGGEDDEKKDGEENDEKKDEEQKGEQGEKKGDQGEKKGDEQKGEQGEKKDEEKKGEEQKGEQGEEKGDEEKEQKEQKGQPEPKDGDEKKEQEQETPAQKAKKMKREEARRLLDALRARERPLTPLEMRGQQKKQQAKGGKDW